MINSISSICSNIEVIERIIKGVVDPFRKCLISRRQGHYISRTTDHHTFGFVNASIGNVF